MRWMIRGMALLLLCAAPAPTGWAETVELDGRSIATLADALARIDRNDGQADEIMITTQLVMEPAAVSTRGRDNLTIQPAGLRGPAHILARGDGNFVTFDCASDQTVTLRNLTIVPDFNETRLNAAIRVAAGDNLSNHTFVMDGVTVTAATDARHTPATADDAWSDAHRHFRYGFFDGSVREATDGNTFVLTHCQLLHAEKANLRLSLHYARELTVENCRFERSQGNGMQLEQIGELEVTVRDSSLSHNGVAGVYYRGGLAPCKLTLEAGTKLNDNGRWGIYSHGDAGAAREIVIRGSRENPVETSGNKLVGVTFAEFEPGAVPRIGPCENWVLVGNRNAIYFDARQANGAGTIGPFTRCLIANGEKDAMVWRIAGLQAEFRDCTFANNAVYHSYHRWGGRNLGEPNRITFTDSIFAGSSSRAAASDVDNADQITFRNCALVSEGPAAMQWSPPYKTAEGRIDTIDCITADPAFLSQDAIPPTPESFAVDNPAFGGRASDGGDLSGFGVYRGSGRQDASAAPPPPAITVEQRAEFAWRENRQTTEPDYRGYVIASIPEPLPFEHVEGRTYRADLARVAALHMYLFEWTGRRAYAERAGQMLRAILDNWDRHDDFFMLHPAMLTFQKLEQAGIVDDDLRELARRRVREKYYPAQRGDHNQTACRVAGLVLSLKLFPDIPERQERLEYIDAAWNDWYRFRDTTENAPNYNRIFWQHHYLTVGIMDWREKLLDPHVRAALLRYRDHVSPAGMIPGYGDSDPWYHEGMWASVFEYAAALYQEPTLRWAAWQMLPLPEPKTYVSGSRVDYRAAGRLLDYCYADQWADRSLTPRMPERTARLLTRRTPEQDAALDRIVLGPDRRPGSPFAMIEIFADRGGHSHPEWGALQYYEVDARPMLHGLGYNNRFAPHGHVFMMRPPDEPFPHKPEPFEPGRWYAHRYSLHNLWPKYDLPQPGLHGPALQEAAQPRPAAPDPDERHFDTFIFRVENGGRVRRDAIPPTFLWVDNLRLTGPAGDMLLDDFESDVAARWRHAYGLELSDDRREGDHSMKARCEGGINFISREFDQTWHYSDYTHIAFDWKLSDNPQGWARPFIGRLSDRGRDLSWHVPALQFPAEIRSAHADSRDGDSYGEVVFEDYFTPGTVMRRQVVLTREGVLVVRDTIGPGADADGWQAGPLWHAWHAPESSGDNWFSAPGYARYAAQDRSMLVWMNPKPGRQFGVQHVALWGHFDPFTIHAREPLRTGGEADFVSILMVHEPRHAEALADAIHVSSEGSAALAALTTPGGAHARVRIDPSGRWSVAR